MNGKRIILNGGCLYYDNGCLGVVVYDCVEEWKVELMKVVGFNVVCILYNIFLEEFFYVCDCFGLLVIDEIFDGWCDSKN